MKKLVFIIFILFAAKTHALLPPFYQSVKEIQSILEDKRFITDSSNDGYILEIGKKEGGYLIITSRYHQFVEINYIHQDMPGPAKYELKFHEKY